DDRAARGDAAVDGDDRSGDVAGAWRGEKDHQVRDLLRARRPPSWILLAQFRPTALVAIPVERAPSVDLDHALGLDRAGVDADDANAKIEALAAERPGESHQRRVRRAPRNVV